MAGRPLPRQAGTSPCGAHAQGTGQKAQAKLLKLGSIEQHRDVVERPLAASALAGVEHVQSVCALEHARIM